MALVLLNIPGTYTVMLIADLAMITGNIGRKGVGVNPLRGQNNVQVLQTWDVNPSRRRIL
jgi:predicted molibdopterin-dependent oxidoreductase YjgC